MLILTTFALFATLMGGISLFGYRRYVRPARVQMSPSESPTLWASRLWYLVRLWSRWDCHFGVCGLHIPRR